MVKYDDDKDALAAEYVLGTLSSDERDRAEAMLAIDPGFEAAVRQWERRLGELNVMVEAVEPPPEVWDKIKVGMDALAQAGVGQEEAEIALPRLENAAPYMPEESHEPRGLEEPQQPEPQPLGELQQPQELAEAPASEPAATLEQSGKPREEAEETEEAEKTPEALSLAALEASLFEPEPAPESGAAAESGAAPSPRVELRSADVIILARRVARWRRLTAGTAAIAALLAVYVAVWHVAPNLIPAPLRPESADMTAPAPTPARLQQDRLVAVLQQEPTAPAFLLTLDTRNRSLTVRRVAATPEPGRSYQLWLIARQFPNPRSLGVVGDSEFTQRAFPANYDLDTLLTASYAVSLEPAGGSPSGVPTGPVLFTGKAVESLPGTPPPT